LKNTGEITMKTGSLDQPICQEVSKLTFIDDNDNLKIQEGSKPVQTPLENSSNKIKMPEE
jgi:hypothetical protein